MTPSPHTFLPWSTDRHTHIMIYTGSVNRDNTWASTGMFHGMWWLDLGGNVHWSCYHGNLLPIGSVSLLTLKQCQLLSVFEILYHLSCHLVNFNCLLHILFIKTGVRFLDSGTQAKSYDGADNLKIQSHEKLPVTK